MRVHHERLAWHRSATGRYLMKLRRLRKAEDSHPQGQCPALYAADDPAWFVAQGKYLDEVTRDSLVEVADDGTAVLIPRETVVRSLGMLLTEAGRPELAGQLEEVLLNRSVHAT
jgi:hypothetical protein